MTTLALGTAALAKSVIVPSMLAPTDWALVMLLMRVMLNKHASRKLNANFIWGEPPRKNVGQDSILSHIFSP
jgi:hypothetical protein